MKLTINGLDIRNRIYERIAEINGYGFLNDLMVDQDRVKTVNAVANEMDMLEQALIDGMER